MQKSIKWIYRRLLQPEAVLNAKESDIHINDLLKTKAWFGTRHWQPVVIAWESKQVSFSAAYNR